MKTITSRLMTSAAATLMLVACNKYADDTAATGAFSLRIVVPEETEQAAAAAPQTRIATRAMNQDELLNTAAIKIYRGDFTGLVREFVYSEMSGPIYLPAESYRIDIYAGEAAKQSPAVASFDQKSYKGSKEFSVTPGVTTPVQVEASVNNVITAVTFDQSVAATFSNYTFKIGLDKEDTAQQLEYTASNAGAEGYFIATGFEPSLYWTFTATPADGSEIFTKSGEIAAVEQGKKYAMNLKYTEHNGTLSFDLTVDTSTVEYDDQIVFEPVSTGLAASSIYEIWAAHATVHADVDEGEYGTENIFFEYRPAASQGEWSRTAANRDSEGMYSATLTGLTPATEYEYRLLVPDKQTNEPVVTGSSLNFTTEAAATIPNGGFESVSKAESSKYYSFYDPVSQIIDSQSKWWDTGNKGSTTVGSSYTITDPDTSDFKEGSQSAHLHSEYVILKFAAGNIFSGSFGETIGTSGGTVYFGRPFTARPTALRFWMKYSTNKVNCISAYPEDDVVTKEDYDRALIRIVLGDWDYRTYGGNATSPVLVDTTKPEKFVSFPSDKATIAYAEKVVRGDAANSTNVWQQVTIPLEYNDTNRYPTHIIISCAASMLGDYFTGCDSSELWLDGMELIYE